MCWALVITRTREGLQGERFTPGMPGQRDAVGCRMSAQLAQGRVVTRVKRQVSILYVAHQQPAPFEVPADASTPAVNEALQICGCRRLHPPEARDGR